MTFAKYAAEAIVSDDEEDDDPEQTRSDWLKWGLGAGALGLGGAALYHYWPQIQAAMGQKVYDNSGAGNRLAALLSGGLTSKGLLLGAGVGTASSIPAVSALTGGLANVGKRITGSQKDFGKIVDPTQMKLLAGINSQHRSLPGALEVAAGKDKAVSHLADLGERLAGATPNVAAPTGGVLNQGGMNPKHWGTLLGEARNAGAANSFMGRLLASDPNAPGDWASIKGREFNRGMGDVNDTGILADRFERLGQHLAAPIGPAAPGAAPQTVHDILQSDLKAGGTAGRAGLKDPAHLWAYDAAAQARKTLGLKPGDAWNPAAHGGALRDTMAMRSRWSPRRTLMHAGVGGLVGAGIEGTVNYFGGD